MSYFNPKIYNKQNLKEKDRIELEYWEDEFVSLIKTAQDNFQLGSTGSKTIDRIREEIVDNFCKELKIALGCFLQDNVVGIIDHYDEEVDEVEEYETFFYADTE